MAAALSIVRQGRRAHLPPAVALVLVAYGSVAALLGPFTAPQSVATAIAIAIAVGLAVARGWLRPGYRGEPTVRGGDWPMASLGVWAALLGLLTFVQMYHFNRWPRDVYPTISSLAAQIFPLYPVRALAYAGWLWLGWYVLDR
jgi:pimeloyl-ACP methyl ester carboxylesterase